MQAGASYIARYSRPIRMHNYGRARRVYLRMRYFTRAILHVLFRAAGSAVNMEGYDKIYEFLSCGTYPEDFSKNQKRILRRKCTDHFKVCCKFISLLFRWSSGFLIL